MSSLLLRGTSLGETILFWMSAPPSSAMDPARWVAFTDTMARLIVGLFVVFVVLTAGLYAVVVRGIRIRGPGDLFRPFRPLHCLWLALVPAIVLFREYHQKIGEQFPHVSAFAPGDAALVAIAGGLATLAGSYLVICTPGVTPAKFRYRPFEWALRGRAIRPRDAAP